MEIWPVFFVGIMGAIIANTSGTGGGVVFIPVFNILANKEILILAPAQIVAASFFIQCFGMTMGANRWTWRLLHEPNSRRTNMGQDATIGVYAKIIFLVLPLSLPIMLITQRFNLFDAPTILLLFKSFSIIFGLALIITTWTINNNRPERIRLEKIDLLILPLIGIFGGFITALFSVGVGELMAIYLFIRHFPVIYCAGAACVVSSISVLSGTIYHIEMGNVPWDVVLLAGPGAAIGGYVARPIALWLGAKRLKTADGFWIMGSSLYLIYLNIR
ncbi:sulfite exporter TauE/SafE family protein [Sphingorhabdus lutea]|nr:sulfite exporter TauE/SafE family protein [Sphingorhabdus lutea]